MTYPTSWRGFDLTDRLARIDRFFSRGDVTSAWDVPILVNTPCYFAFATYDKPDDYFTNPASMVAYQEQGYERHLASVQDDVVPYFMPWFGTGVLASAFGCEVDLSPGPGNDPAVSRPSIATPADAARLRMPDPHRDGLMPRVLSSIDYARHHSDLPVGLTDMQGPLNTLGQMCGPTQLFTWMYDEPAMVHDLLDLVTDAFIDWVVEQKSHIGEPRGTSNGLQGVGASSIGVWESDDDMGMVGPDLYREFVLPRLVRIFRAFGGGSVHFCGRAYQHLDSVLESGATVVNNSPLGQFRGLGEFRKGLGSRVVLQLQDMAPVDARDYYQRLFAEFDDLRGVMVATFVGDNVGMTADGGYVAQSWEPVETAGRVAAVIRECLADRLADIALGTPATDQRGS